MATKTDKVQEHDDKDERCPSCGYCKHCGQSRQQQFVPYVYPYPAYPRPAWYVAPKYTYTVDCSGGTSDPIWVSPNANAAAGGNTTFYYSNTGSSASPTCIPLDS